MRVSASPQTERVSAEERPFPDGKAVVEIIWDEDDTVDMRLIRVNRLYPSLGMTLIIIS